MNPGTFPFDKCCENGKETDLRDALKSGQINSHLMQGSGLLVILSALLGGISIYQSPTIPGTIGVTSATVNVKDTVGSKLISCSVTNVSGSCSVKIGTGSPMNLPVGATVEWTAEPGATLFNDIEIIADDAIIAYTRRS